jgi:hypothetical protein
MSDNNSPITPPPPPVPSTVAPPPPPRSGCLTAVMVLFGVILLLPGLCAIIFGVGELTGSSFDSTVMWLVMLGLLVGLGGVLLIRAAIRGRRP